MIISATLTNSSTCQFDDTWFDVKNEAEGVKAAKQWAAGRGGRYTLDITKMHRYDAWCKTIGEFRYSGKCRRAVAL